MSKPNIDFVMGMTKGFLEGKSDAIDYSLDFSYEVEKRYTKMLEEDSEYSQLINEYLVAEGVSYYSTLSNKAFIAKMQENYKHVQDAVGDRSH